MNRPLPRKPASLPALARQVLATARTSGLTIATAESCTGGMVAFEVLDGREETIKKFLQFLFAQGLIAFTAGRNPVMVRMLPPMGILTEALWTKAMNVFESSLVAFEK